MTSENSIETVEAKRREVAEAQRSNWQFPFPVQDVGGWKICGCDWHCSIFLDIGQPESIRVVFYIVFKIGTPELVRVQATLADQQHVGKRGLATKIRIKGDEEYLAICIALAKRSCFFSCMPLPDGEYEVEFKPNEGIEELIQETVAKVAKAAK